MPIDYEEIERFDIIGVGDNSIVYIDDGINQRDCSQQDCLYDVRWNPCYDQPIKANTTIGLTVITQEADGDDVSVRVIYDYGSTDNFTTNWTSYQDAGFPHPFSFSNTSKLITSGVLRVEARENGKNPNATGYEIYPFTIANDGLEFGDSTCSNIDDVDVDVINVTGEELDLESNALANLLDETTGRAGFGRTAGWIFVMILVGIFIIVEMRGSSSQQFWIMIS